MGCTSETVCLETAKTERAKEETRHPRGLWFPAREPGSLGPTSLGLID